MSGALSGEAGRRLVLTSSSSASPSPGTRAWASRRSSYTAPARGRRSNPTSSLLAPTTTRPSPRGTRYTGQPRTEPRNTQVSRGGPTVRSRRVCPLTGRTAGRAASGSPPIRADHTPQASTTTGAVSSMPSASRNPAARPARSSSSRAATRSMVAPSRSHARSNAWCRRLLST